MTTAVTIQGNRVREVLKELGITQEELARKLGMKRETLNRKINGQANWTFKDLEKLTTTTGKKLEYFLNF